jgi:catechol 2,3-dioxygenase-like lactoylglutathione lyase family enzyme
MAQFRYLALLSDDPAALAGFYADHLGLTEIDRTADGDVSLTDGFCHFAIFRMRAALNEARLEAGLHHVGLQVDNLDAALARYKAHNPLGIAIEENRGPAHGEVRILDPEGNPIILSEGDFGVPEPVQRFPRMVHIAMNAYLPQTVLEFYIEVLGFREVGQSYVWRNMGKQNRFAGEGHCNLAIHPFIVDEPGHEGRFGVNHIGFLADDMEERLGRLSAVVDVAKRPDNRPYAEYRLRDLDGNMFDLSQRKGWEVDVEKWDMVA